MKQNIVTLVNPTAAVLKALAAAMDTDNVIAAPAAPAACTTSAPAFDYNAIKAAAPAVGAEVHWNGPKFIFDGVVEKRDDSAYRPDDKFLFIRAIGQYNAKRTKNKLYSLTLADVASGNLYPADICGGGGVAYEDVTEDEPFRVDAEYAREDLEVGTPVHWKGTLGEFNATVDSIDSDAFRCGEKVIWLRRDDTGKKVSLTIADLDDDNKALTLR